MAEADTNEETAGGLTGRLAGKAKEAAGAVLGREDLQREGRLQQASVDAEREAAREARDAELEREQAELAERRQETEDERGRLQAELDAEQRKEAIEQHEAQVEGKIQTEAGREEARIEANE